MTIKPLMLDFYCCEGGAGKGYADAGWNVLGFDLFEDYTQARNPFVTLKMDAIEGIRKFSRIAQARHASPPCQRHSAGTRAGDRSKYPDLIEQTREVLEESGQPYVIENVVGAPLKNPVELCGCMFNLTAVDTDGITVHMWRPRQFETNWDLEQPTPGTYLVPKGLPVHDNAFHEYEWVAGAYGGARRDKYEAKYIRKGGYVPASKAVVEELMGIDWMTWDGLYQAIPPVYTESIGRQLLRVVS